MKKAIWNSLPAKPEDVARVLKALQRGKTKISQLPEMVNLSKTRTLCAVDHLMRKGVAEEVERGFLMLKRPSK